jgi:hypothetical protein
VLASKFCRRRHASAPWQAYQQAWCIVVLFQPPHRPSTDPAKIRGGGQAADAAFTRGPDLRPANLSRLAFQICQRARLEARLQYDLIAPHPKPAHSRDPDQTQSPETLQYGPLCKASNACTLRSVTNVVHDPRRQRSKNLEQWVNHFPSMPWTNCAVSRATKSEPLFFKHADALPPVVNRSVLWPIVFLQPTNGRRGEEEGNGGRVRA